MRNIIFSNIIYLYFLKETFFVSGFQLGPNIFKNSTNPTKDIAIPMVRNKYLIFMSRIIINIPKIETTNNLEIPPTIGKNIFPVP